MKILIIAEHDQHKLEPATEHVIAAATELGQDITLFIIGFHCEPIIADAKKFAAVKHMVVADHEVYQHQLAENCAALIAEGGKNYDYILAPATTFGKNILPRVAALLNIGMISDVVKIINADTFVRPMYAGNILATIQSMDAIKLLTIRTTAFPVAEQIHESQVSEEKITHVFQNELSQFVSNNLTQSKRPELTAARVVIAGGRGFKNAENFKMLEGIADQLHAAIGASRAAVDAGFAPNDYQVGQTGKMVAPDLYIAIGISGAIQHVAGMKDSKVIVAINNDPDAPIFQIADYGLVGDLFTLLPVLKEELAKIGK